MAMSPELTADFDLSYWGRGTSLDYDHMGWDANDEPDQESYICSEESRRLVEMTRAPTPPPKKTRSNSYASGLARKRNKPPTQKKPPPPKKRRNKNTPWTLAKKRNPPKKPASKKPKAKKLATPPPKEKRPAPKAKKSTYPKKPRTKKPPQAAKKPSVAKKQASIPATSQEGYPMKLCEYENSEDCFVYRPPGYCTDPVREWHCCTCHLKPCISTKYYGEVVDSIATAKIMRCGTSLPDLDELEAIKILEKHRCNALNIEYNNKTVPPPCVVSFAKRAAKIKPGIFDDDDTDDDSILNYPYNLMRDRQLGDPPMSELEKSQKAKVKGKIPRVSMGPQDLEQEQDEECLEHEEDEECEWDG
jgi:hypothetical protein